MFDFQVHRRLSSAAAPRHLHDVVDAAPGGGADRGVVPGQRVQAAAVAGASRARCGHAVHLPPGPPLPNLRAGLHLRRDDHVRSLRHHHRLQPAHHPQALTSQQEASQGRDHMTCTAVHVLCV